MYLLHLTCRPYLVLASSSLQSLARMEKKVALTYMQRRPVLISTYTLVHAFTLTIMTFILLMNVMPAAITTMVPRASELKYDDKFADRMCRELDDGFGWDTKWLDDCVSSFRILTTGIVWIGLVMMVAQWWALSSVWSWLGELNGKRPRQIYEDGDLERAKGMNGKEKSSFDYKCKE